MTEFVRSTPQIGTARRCGLFSASSTIELNLFRQPSPSIYSAKSALVDYYKLHDAVDFFVTKWMDDLCGSLPSDYGRDLLMWLCISSVFRINKIFSVVTKVAAENAPGKIPSQGLPISPDTIDKLNMQRAAALNEVSELLETVKSGFMSGVSDGYSTNGCSIECRAHLLGSLMVQTYDSKLRNPGTPELPYPGYSVSEILEKVRAIQDPEREWHRPPSGSYSCSCLFSLKSPIQSRLPMVVNKITGLTRP
ncbi:hypothetical protein B0T16DRAFT_23473 [Cercophora newfieldiana]|uniref:Uncharacterized protein n=1 Tax=Cercophora newfieldiana TaxID=92897 RepID=A0AA39YQ19_9PEZI|nr:hypothetical protein B0T16DRAFT_23473 [Cercophora newfieldiana]